jgi:hypothetical protein
VRARHGEVLRHIAEKGDLPDDVLAQLQKAIEEFKSTFQVTETAEATT